MDIQTEISTHATSSPSASKQTVTASHTLSRPSPWTLSNLNACHADGQWRPHSQPITVSAARTARIPFSPPLQHTELSSHSLSQERPSPLSRSIDSDEGLSPISKHSPSAFSYLDALASADVTDSDSASVSVSDGETQNSPQVRPSAPSHLLSSQLAQSGRPLAPKIKTVAFDYGGVTFTDGKSKASRYLQDRYGYDQRIIFELMTSPQSWDLRRGRITSEQFWAWAQSVLPEGYSAETIRVEWCNGYELDASIIELINELRHKYRIVSYTDGIPDRVTELERRYTFRHLFHAEVQSYERDAVKTDGAFARALLDTAQCGPDEMVLIDDNDEETQHVRALGIPVLLYRTGQADELRRQLYASGVDVRLPSGPPAPSNSVL